MAQDLAGGFWIQSPRSAVSPRAYQAHPDAAPLAGFPRRFRVGLPKYPGSKNTQPDFTGMSLGSEAREGLHHHPTVKPVAMLLLSIVACCCGRRRAQACAPCSENYPRGAREEPDDEEEIAHVARRDDEIIWRDELNDGKVFLRTALPVKRRKSGRVHGVFFSGNQNGRQFVSKEPIVVWGEGHLRRIFGLPSGPMITGTCICLASGPA